MATMQPVDVERSRPFLIVEALLTELSNMGILNTTQDKEILDTLDDVKDCSRDLHLVTDIQSKFDQFNVCFNLFLRTIIS